MKWICPDCQESYAQETTHICGVPNKFSTNEVLGTPLGNEIDRLREIIRELQNELDRTANMLQMISKSSNILAVQQLAEAQCGLIRETLAKALGDGT